MGSGSGLPREIEKWLVVESARSFLSHGVNLAHGVVEGQAEDLNAEVNGVAGEVALGVTNFFDIVLFIKLAS